MKFNIPTSFKLFSSTYKVVHDEDLLFEEEALGFCNYRKEQITLLSPDDKEYSQQAKEVIFFHEFSHILFMAIGRKDLADDEGIVDATGNALHQFFTTCKGDFNSTFSEKKCNKLPKKKKKKKKEKLIELD